MNVKFDFEFDFDLVAQQICRVKQELFKKFETFVSDEVKTAFHTFEHNPPQNVEIERLFQLDQDLTVAVVLEASRGAQFENSSWKEYQEYVKALRRTHTFVGRKRISAISKLLDKVRVKE